MCQGGLDHCLLFCCVVHIVVQDDDRLSSPHITGGGWDPIPTLLSTNIHLSPQGMYKTDMYRGAGLYETEGMYFDVDFLDWHYLCDIRSEVKATLQHGPCAGASCFDSFIEIYQMMP
jgi:hypothetical protein